MARVLNRLLGLVGLFVFLHLSFLAFKRYLESPWSSGLDNVGADFVNEPPAVIPNEGLTKDGKPRIDPKYCRYNACLKGRWVPREPQFANLKEFQEVFAKGGSPWHRCPIDGPPPGVTRTEEETKELEGQRLVDMMNWVWKPETGEQIPFDAEDFVVRLLKAPAGIIFMGDSVSAGHEHAFGSYLEQGGIKFQRIPVVINGNQTEGIRPHILHPDDPLTYELQRRAGVPDSRLKYPIFNIIEDHMLLHPPDIRRITENHGAEEGFTWHLKMKRVDGWEDYLADITRPREGEEDSVTADTILVVNTGAHWSRGTLHMLPQNLGVAEEQRLLTEVYKDMMRILVEKLSVFRQFKIIYRSTSPAHPNCRKKKFPYPNYEAARNAEATYVENVKQWAQDDGEAAGPAWVRLRWDWDMFNVHNGLWKTEVARLQEERKMKTKTTLEMGVDPEDLDGAGLGPKWLYVDFWEMALQRPDAHSDCLHWCLPAMYSEWTRHLYHLLYLEDLQ
ncbi:hypothetical protein CC1G_05882 [Coprinopsis cinerea okayama7|uniref:Uncharacterized protein n=1 Tax=Coprinopsis cinerea (strain Okayama-7 / 130 / ATCC MYA-4618 / FGSC 9003) TaxID=240176 RepID=A8NAD1_COPC7|nr:hypothetical protein CC1G_05882 [Coprinopsis cinerea okayama7\|eukprot:XP_001831783.1 hypothetical protein CC1G_05882 [Coprinopsis cinerea okayama7\